jgi:hypothetical protein
MTGPGHVGTGHRRAPYGYRVSMKRWRAVPAVMVLVPVLLLVGGCMSRTGPEARPAPTTTSEAPSQELVTWAGRLCTANDQLVSEHESGRDLTTTPPDQFVLVQARHYLGFVDSTVSRLAGEFASMPRTGIEDADEYVANVAAELVRVEPEVGRLSADTATAFQLPDADVLSRVRNLVELFDSVERATGGLESLVQESEEFAAAYERTPTCDPDAPPPSGSPAPSSESSAEQPAGLPKAADGRNLAACPDGTCEVELRGKARVTVGSFVLDVSVRGGSVTVTHDFGGGGGGMATLGGPGGEASFGSGNQTVTISLSGVERDRAVVKFVLR